MIRRAPAATARAATAAALALLLASTSTATAQEPDRDEARTEFLAGLAAAEALEWDRALARFERSYALSPTAAALFNAATAMRALGRHVSARDALERLLRAHDHELEPDVRAAAERMRDEERARVATLLLQHLPETPVTLRLDGTPRDDTGERPLALDADPGERGLSIEQPGHEPFFWNGTLDEGERRELTVTLEPAVTSETSWYERPWVWLAAGGLVIAGALVAVLVATSGAELEPRTDSVLRP